MSEVLKSCPFCGSAVKEYGNNIIGIQVECPKCEAFMERRNRATVYSAWNTRHDPAGELAQALRAVLEDWPTIHCDSLHHERNDYHGLGEPCPVAARLAASHIKATAALASYEAQKEGKRG